MNSLGRRFFGIRIALAASAVACVLGTWAWAQSARICGGGPFECLDQGWADHERAWWYTVSQGSRLLPLKWMLALELDQPALAGKFLSTRTIDKFRYLANPVSRDNPYGLPVGFAVDKEEGRWTRIMCGIFGATCARETMREPWVGLNCAACHTAQISFAERNIRIEGAPTVADFQGFHEELLRSLRATLSNQDKFNRFAAEVLEGADGAESRNALRKELEEQIAWKAKLQEKNGTAMRFGHARLDAQGHILNKISLVVGAPDQTTDFQSDAPVSYPFIWNAPQHDKVQWNGIAENRFKFAIFGKEHDLGALVRNTSEVLGVFAQIDVSEDGDNTGYVSSLRLSKMIDIERQLGRLQSPRWPEDILGKIAWEIVPAGEKLFRERCAGCHAHLDPADTRKPVKADMRPLDEIGTDIWTACNTFLHRSKSGRLQGRKQFIYKGEDIGQEEFTRNMLAHVAIGSIVGRADELVGKAIDDIFGRSEEGAAPSDVVMRDYLPGVDNPLKKDRARKCIEGTDSLLAYKARPLNGIWATAPYLHNGSVATLYDLLLPSAIRTTLPPLLGEGPAAAADMPTRPESFHVGSRQFDAVKVGIKSVAADNTSEFRVRTTNGVPILGNYNSGHEGRIYGIDNLKDDERWAIVEYLKTL